MTSENSQLRKDIQTLIDFKNELESLAEDQDKQIQNLNNVIALGDSIDLRTLHPAVIKAKDETIEFMETEAKAKDTEISELNKDIKHLMDERTVMKTKQFEVDQKLKSLRQITIKDLHRKITK